MHWLYVAWCVVTALTIAGCWWQVHTALAGRPWEMRLLTFLVFANVVIRTLGDALR